jgi:hypothetical protein
MSEKKADKVIPAMPAGESKEGDKEKPKPHEPPKKKTKTRKRMKHMKNLEIIMDELELNSMSKEIITSRWYVNRTRLMKQKKTRVVDDQNCESVRHYQCHRSLRLHDHQH